jgi:hypothetical protein
MQHDQSKGILVIFDYTGKTTRAVLSLRKNKRKQQAEAEASAAAAAKCRTERRHKKTREKRTREDIMHDPR